MNLLIVSIVAALILCIFLSRNKQLVENWREAFKWYSAWAFTTIGTIQGSVMVYITQEQLQAKIVFYPTWTYGELVQAVITFLALSGLWGRLLSQKKTSAAPEAEQP